MAEGQGAGTDAPVQLAGTALATGRPHPRLTALDQCASAEQSKLTDVQKQSVLGEAAACVKQMRGTRDLAGDVILEEFASDVTTEYAAAALALMCG